MNKDSPDKVTGGSHQGAGPSAAEESLSEALNGLEQILEQRKPAPPGVHEPDREQPKPGLADPQYTIPLLHDVVVPGGNEPNEPNEPLSDQPRGEEPLEPRAEATEACRKLAERLANEIEVIVQARTETAVQEAAEDIREQVRNHLEIMLPELIEDLNALRRR